MTGYSLFVRMFAPIYRKYKDKIPPEDALGASFLHYCAYLWHNLTDVEQSRWNTIAIINSGSPTEKSLSAEVLIHFQEVLLRDTGIQIYKQK